jgi:hypothetical protein
MCEPRRLTTLLASTACYRETFVFCCCCCCNMGYLNLKFLQSQLATGLHLFIHGCFSTWCSWIQSETDKSFILTLANLDRHITPYLYCACNSVTNVSRRGGREFAYTLVFKQPVFWSDSTRCLPQQETEMLSRAHGFQSERWRNPNFSLAT